MLKPRFIGGALFGAALLALVLVLTLTGLGAGGTSAALGATTTNTSTPSATPQPKAAQSPKSCCQSPTQQAISDAEWAAAARDLGLGTSQFNQELQAGKSVADLAATTHVDVAKIRTDMVAAGQNAVAAALQSRAVDQAGADSLNHSLVPAIADKVTHANTEPADAATPVAGEKDLIRQKGAAAGADLAAAVTDAELQTLAAKLGIPTDQLKTDLGRGCVSIAAAGGHAVDLAQLRQAMIAAGQASVDAGLASGTLTQAQASELRDGVIAAFADKVSASLAHSGALPGNCSAQATPAG